MRENEIGKITVSAAINVHSSLGPGLLESAYERCLVHELTKRELAVQSQVMVSFRYDNLVIDNGYRIDLLIDKLVVVELKAIESVLPAHRGQLLSYLRLGQFKLGFLLNFNVAHMRDGITQLVNGL
jgi:GxxExxY protein